MEMHAAPIVFDENIFSTVNPIEKYQQNKKNHIFRLNYNTLYKILLFQYDKSFNYAIFVKFLILFVLFFQALH